MKQAALISSLTSFLALVAGDSVKLVTRTSNRTFLMVPLIKTNWNFCKKLGIILRKNKGNKYKWWYKVHEIDFDPSLGQTYICI